MDEGTAAWAMDQIMEGGVPDVTMAAFLVAHHGKGETVEEMTGLVRAMYAHAVPLPGLADAVDIVGTGGDRAKTVNVSSTASFIIAGAGQRLVKHGNRATSSASGSADVLEVLGLALDLEPDQSVRLAEEVGMAFAFANVYHPAMRFIAPVRRQIAVPSAFNILGPLTNPARTRATAIGVADLAMAPLVAGVLAARGDSALVGGPWRGRPVRCATSSCSTPLLLWSPPTPWRTGRCWRGCGRSWPSPGSPWTPVPARRSWTR
jgi:anthranilate phosphoribosyltransferase